MSTLEKNTDCPLNLLELYHTMYGSLWPKRRPLLPISRQNDDCLQKLIYQQSEGGAESNWIIRTEFAGHWSGKQAASVGNEDSVIRTMGKWSSSLP